jgi:hypothetical protein
MAWFNYDEERTDDIPNPVPDRRGVDKFKIQVRTRRVALMMSYAPDWYVVACQEFLV